MNRQAITTTTVSCAVGPAAATQTKPRLCVAVANGSDVGGCLAASCAAPLPRGASIPPCRWLLAAGYVGLQHLKLSIVCGDSGYW